MNREAILAEIRRLEAQKASSPDLAAYLNEEITRLCDQLKQGARYQPRKVV